jgi:hypothetical protein
MNLRHCALSSLAAAVIVLPFEGSIASTCKDELDRFESRLYGSQIPSTDPQLFQELVREAERAAQLRDEERCLRRVAELNDALPEPGVQPQSSSRPPPQKDPADEAARPKAPILLVTGEDDEPQRPADDEDD